MADVPVIKLGHLSPEQRRAYIIADNRLAELAGWDEDILRIEFQELGGIDLDFDVTDIGFEMAEIDLIIGDAKSAGLREEEDAVPEPGDVATVAGAGDLWQLGSHLLFCGDALDANSYKIFLGMTRPGWCSLTLRITFASMVMYRDWAKQSTGSFYKPREK